MNQGLLEKAQGAWVVSESSSSPMLFPKESLVVLSSSQTVRVHKQPDIEQQNVILKREDVIKVDVLCVLLHVNTQM